LNGQPQSTEIKSQAAGYLIAVTGCLLIVAGLVWAMIHYTKPEPLGEDRAAERRKALADLRAANAEVLDNPNFAWQDQGKGIVRIPIERAMAMALELWKSPAAARSNLNARVEKAFPPPPALE
jgi:hypothetical protein